MFLSEYMKSNTNLKKLAANSGNFLDNFTFWQDNLFERSLKLFKWNNTEDIPAHEFEMILMSNGMAAVGKFDKKLTLFNCAYAGAPTEYFDIYKEVSIYSPIISGVYEIGKDVEVIINNSTRTSVLPIIKHYAIQLAHLSTTINNYLINSRIDSIPIASTDSARQSYKNWYNALSNGVRDAVTDPAFSTLDFKDMSSKATADSIGDLIEARDNLLIEFYHAIGVSATKFKKGNLIQAEINDNNVPSLLNLNDMFEERKRSVEKVNKLFGCNITVDISDELKEDDEYDKSEKVVENSESSEQTNARNK